MTIDDPFLERNDGVVGDVNVFRADFRAAFGDVAEANAEGLLEEWSAIDAVHRVHFQGGGLHEECRSRKHLMFVMLAQYMTNILAEKALNALPKLLHPIDVLLIPLPICVGTRSK